MPAETVLPIDPCVDTEGWSPLLRVDDVTSELLALLEQVPDPRDRRGRRYRLPSLLVLALSAVAPGVRSFYAIADWVSCASAEVLARVGIRFRARPAAQPRRRRNDHRRLHRLVQPAAPHAPPRPRPTRRSRSCLLRSNRGQPTGWLTEPRGCMKPGMVQ